MFFLLVCFIFQTRDLTLFSLFWQYRKCRDCTEHHQEVEGANWELSFLLMLSITIRLCVICLVCVHWTALVVFKVNSLKFNFEMTLLILIVWNFVGVILLHSFILLFAILVALCFSSCLLRWILVYVAKAFPKIF